MLVRPNYRISPEAVAPYVPEPPSNVVNDAMVAWTTASHTFKKNWLYRKGLHQTYTKVSFWNLPGHVKQAWIEDNKA